MFFWLPELALEDSRNWVLIPRISSLQNGKLVGSTVQSNEKLGDGTLLGMFWKVHEISLSMRLPLACNHPFSGAVPVYFPNLKAMSYYHLCDNKTLMMH